MTRKQCIFEGCTDLHSSRGYCNRHYQQWLAGKITHPELGEFKRSEKGEKIKKALDESQGKYTGPLESTETSPGKFIHHHVAESDESIMLTMAREHLRKTKIFADALIELGQGDQVKKEIGLFAQRYE